MEYRTDEEQLERIKGWWGKYGNILLYSLVILFATVYGYKAWNDRQVGLLEKSSSLYTRAMDAYSDGKDSEFSAISNQLMQDFPNSVYTDFIRMLQAKQATDKGDIEKALGLLRATQKQARQASVANIASYRLARLYFSNGQYDDAAKQIEKLQGTDFAFLSHEINGDILAANGDYAAAKKEYETALQQQKEKNAGFVSIVNYKISLLPNIEKI